jgi:putative ABC transport system ATP-binding protein
MTALLSTHLLTKTFHAHQPNEVQVLKGISIELQKASCQVLYGASGSGKSTLLAILAGLLKPTSGEYIFGGQPVSRWSEKFLTQFRRTHIGIVFQQFHLVNDLSVFDNVALPLLPQGFSRADITKSVHQAVESVALSTKLSTKVGRLSGGEMQRIAIARALVANPTLLIADEPTAHLDSELSVAILDIFKALKAQGKTILMTTHDEAVRRHAIVDGLWQMKDGRLISPA